VSPRLYNRVTNGSVVLAIVSALLFERLGRWGWIAGLLGILAASAAVITYFSNQSRMRDGAQSKGDQHPKEDTPNTSECDLIYYLDQSSQLKINEKHADLVLSKVLATDVVYYLARDLYEAKYVGKYGVALDCDIAVRPSDLFVDRVVMIVDKLCSQERDLEFEVTPEGNFLIRQAKRAQWSRARSPERQTEAPTLPFPEKVQ
jgi:hypothetical protein